MWYARHQICTALTQPSLCYCNVSIHSVAFNLSSIHAASFKPCTHPVQASHTCSSTRCLGTTFCATLRCAAGKVTSVQKVSFLLLYRILPSSLTWGSNSVCPGEKTVLTTEPWKFFVAGARPLGQSRQKGRAGWQAGQGWGQRPGRAAGVGVTCLFQH